MPGLEYDEVTFCEGSPLLDAATVCVFPFPKFQTYCRIDQFVFVGASRKPPTGCNTSPELKIGALGLADRGKFIVGTDAFSAWA